MYIIMLPVLLTLGILIGTSVHADVQVTWYGHACFMVTFSDQGKVLFDPFNEDMPYQLPSDPVNVVAATHQHFDHNNVDAVESNLVIIGGEKELEVKSNGSVRKLSLPAELTTSISDTEVPFKAVSTYHDKKQGAERGLNTVIKFSADGLTFCHLGDLGHTLTEKQLKQIGEVDVLFIPVGGHFTIDASEATEVLNQIKPKVVFPMHYKTEKLNFPISGVEQFLSGKSQIEKVDSHTISLNTEEVKSLSGEPRVIVLKYFE